MKADTIIRRGLLALSALFAVQFVFAFTYQPTETVAASWVDNPNSMEELLGLSQDVVHARVQKVERAQDFVTDAPGEPEGRDRLPMEVVTLQVVDRMGGKKDGANTIQLFHMGLSQGTPATEGDRRPPGPLPDGVKRPSSPPALGAADSRTIILSDDPQYKRGEEYVLMLRRGPDVNVGGSRVQTQRVVSPEGRYRIRNGRVEPMSHRAEFAHEQKGRSLDQLQESVQRGKSNARPPKPTFEQRGG